ncbi:MAG: S-layer homology domain-containing protein [Firmicutes bacterium]|nr:S-layer homology domain-containing protein [Bacillota bacterium]
MAACNITLVDPNNIAWSVDASNVVYFSVYLSGTERPPCGGGNFTPPSGGETVTADAGTITVGDTTATYAVDPSKLTNLINSTSGSTVTLTIPDQVHTPQVSISLPADAVAALASAGKDVSVSYQGASLQLPKETFSLPGIQNAQGSLVLALGTQTGDAAKALLQSAATGGTTPVSQVFTLDLGFEANGVVTPFTGTFAVPVRAAFEYQPDQLGSAPLGSLGDYWFDGSTWQFVGGIVDGQDHQVGANLWHFSTYTVLSYQKTFADIAHHWAKSTIELMASKHVVKGTSATTFEPDRAITRAEFTAMVVRALGYPLQTPATSPFSDVSTKSWYYSVVATAKAHGLVNGVGGGRFAPEAKITREEMAAVVVRAAHALGKGQTLSASQADAVLKAFADAKSVSAWARAEMAEAVADGLIKGRETGLAPAADSTRAESATVSMRFMDFLGLLGDH